eukprot:551438_1
MTDIAANNNNNNKYQHPPDQQEEVRKPHQRTKSNSTKPKPKQMTDIAANNNNNNKYQHPPDQQEEVRKPHQRTKSNSTKPVKSPTRSHSQSKQKEYTARYIKQPSSNKDHTDTPLKQTNNVKRMKNNNLENGAESDEDKLAPLVNDQHAHDYDDDLHRFRGRKENKDAIRIELEKFPSKVSDGTTNTADMTMMPTYDTYKPGYQNNSYFKEKQSFGPGHTNPSSNLSLGDLDSASSVQSTLLSAIQSTQHTTPTPAQHEPNIEIPDVNINTSPQQHYQDHIEKHYNQPPQEQHQQHHQHHQQQQQQQHRQQQHHQQQQQQQHRQQQHHQQQQ